MWAGGSACIVNGRITVGGFGIKRVGRWAGCGGGGRAREPRISTNALGTGGHEKGLPKNLGCCLGSTNVIDRPNRSSQELARSRDSGSLGRRFTAGYGATI
jgi:hypothetical protein